MGLFQVAYNGYVGKTPLPQRHPERSRGIFLAGGDNVVCVIAEKGNASAKEQERAECKEDFSTAPLMTVGGGRGLVHVAYNEYVWKTLFP